MSWLNTQVSLYKSHSDNIGRAATFEEIIYLHFMSDMQTIFDLRKLERTIENYELKKKELKSKLQCYTPAGLLKSKAKNNLIEIQRSGIMQLDFDKNVCDQYDIEELKLAVYDLPFIAQYFVFISADWKN